MKKIISFVLILTSMCFAQTNSQKILNLESSVQYNNSITHTNANVRQIGLRTSYVQGKKNAGIAVLLSLVLPGMGELYSGSYSSGKYFTIIDAALWGTYIGMNTYSYWTQHRYKAFAASSAGVNNANKDGDFYANVGDYQNEAEYNNDMALQGNFDKMYNGSSFYWSWQTTADRKNYRDMWTSSEQAKNNLRFIVGALILNRIVSAINAVRLVASYNKHLETSWNISVGMTQYANLPSQICFNFQTNL